MVWPAALATKIWHSRSCSRSKINGWSQLFTFCICPIFCTRLLLPSSRVDILKKLYSCKIQDSFKRQLWPVVSGCQHIFRAVKQSETFSSNILFFSPLPHWGYHLFWIISLPFLTHSPSFLPGIFSSSSLVPLISFYGCLLRETSLTSVVPGMINENRDYRWGLGRI